MIQIHNTETLRLVCEQFREVVKEKIDRNTSSSLGLFRFNRKTNVKSPGNEGWEKIVNGVCYKLKNPTFGSVTDLS